MTKFVALKIAVVTISDTRTAKNDKSGETLVRLIKKDKHQIAHREIIKDNKIQIQRVIKKMVAKKIDVVITTGGTGFTDKDLTPEAVEPMFNKKMEGFAVIFHQMSFGKIKTSTIQSRATAGLIKNTLVFCLPGSPNACKDAWTEILKAQLDVRTKPCNFVEIMPRFSQK